MKFGGGLHYWLWGIDARVISNPRFRRKLFGITIICVVFLLICLQSFCSELEKNLGFYSASA